MIGEETLTQENMGAIGLRTDAGQAFVQSVIYREVMVLKPWSVVPLCRLFEYRVFGRYIN